MKNKIPHIMFEAALVHLDNLTETNGRSSYVYSMEKRNKVLPDVAAPRAPTSVPREGTDTLTYIKPQGKIIFPGIYIG